MTKVISAKQLLLLFATIFFATPLPRRLGVWEFLFGLAPAFVGLYPWTISSKSKWKYSHDQLYATPGKLEGQAAIVTGANSGIGYEISLALARLGATVTMACRNPSKCQEAAGRIRSDKQVQEQQQQQHGEGVGTLVKTMSVDLSSLQSVQHFCERYKKSTKNAPLDMLFMNAAIKYAEPISEEHVTNNGLVLSQDGIEQVFATNVVGHHLMYKLLQPVIAHSKRTTPARIVQTSSAVSYLDDFSYKVATDLETLNSVTDPKDPNLYHQAKLAQVLWAKELSARLETTNAKQRSTNSTTDAAKPDAAVYANSANPGAVATKIWHEHADLNAAWAMFNAVHQKLMWTPEDAALTLLYLGTAVEELQRNDFRGRYFHPQATPMDDHELFEEDNAQRTKDLQENLWGFLDELVRDFM